jgi:UDP-glucose 4-epimerase
MLSSARAPAVSRPASISGIKAQLTEPPFSAPPAAAPPPRQVGDVVAALIRLSDHPDAVGHVFNIGNEEELTIRELAERVKAMTGSRSPIEFIDYTRACEEGFEDMPRQVPDLPKIGRLIDYRPTLDLDNILGRIIEHERSR